MNKQDWERRGINDGLGGKTGPFAENDRCWQAKAYWRGHAHGVNGAKALINETVTREGQPVAVLSKEPVDPTAPRTSWAGKSPFEVMEDMKAGAKASGRLFTIPDMSGWPKATKAHAEALLQSIYKEGDTPRRERLLAKLRVLEFRYTKAAPVQAY